MTYLLKAKVVFILQGYYAINKLQVHEIKMRMFWDIIHLLITPVQLQQRVAFLRTLLLCFPGL